MAKRKRLGGPLQDYLSTPQGPAASAPIARVAGDAAASAAFDEVSRELTTAREEGRLVLRLPLESVEAAWMTRDRAHPGTGDDPDFAALLDSLRRNGQRSPIEVVEIAPGRYGLLSGWRRLTALRQLRAEDGEGPAATVLAFLRRPESAQAAYLAMVEENEIRLGLSYYERARIAARSVEAGVFATPKAALQGLFASASRARRSKIGSFLGIYRVLGDEIRFPQAMTERLGLALARVLEADPGAGAQLRARLRAARTETQEDEQGVLAGFLEAETAPPEETPPAPPGPGTPAPAAPRTGETIRETTREIRAGVFLTERPGGLRLSGPAVDDAFRVQLEAWLRDGAAG